MLQLVDETPDDGDPPTELEALYNDLSFADRHVAEAFAGLPPQLRSELHHTLHDLAQAFQRAQAYVLVKAANEGQLGWTR